jgi:APA family basic amino acid/polyamine antiporter
MSQETPSEISSADRQSTSSAFDDSPSTQGQEPQLERRLGLSASFSMITGSMLGIGIFLAPGLAAQHINTSGLFLGAWIFTGMIALAGASIYGKLGVMMPKSGGDYIFHREAFGPSVAFAYGWGLICAAFAGSLAAMSVALCTFQLQPLLGLPGGELFSTGALGYDLTVNWAQIWAIGLIGIITLLNTYGLEISVRLQEFMAYIPLAALFLICGYLFTCDPVQVPETAKAAPLKEGWDLSGISTAFLDIYFAYSGWNAIIYIAGEVKHPKKNIPIALIGGTISVMCLYLFFCAAALHFFGLEGLARHFDIGSGIAQELGGGGVSTGMTALVTIALLASLNATVIGGGRVAYMMAIDGCFIRSAGVLSSRKTPVNALWTLAFIASLIALFVPYETIFSFISLVMVAGGAITAVAFYVVKRKADTAEARALSLADWIVPPLFIIASISVIGIKVSDAIQGKDKALLSIMGLLIILLAFISHSLLRRFKSAPS